MMFTGQMGFGGPRSTRRFMPAGVPFDYSCSDPSLSAENRAKCDSTQQAANNITQNPDQPGSWLTPDAARLLGGAIGTTGDTILGILRSNNQVEIERIRAQSAEALLRLRGQFGDNPPADQAALMQMLAVLGRQQPPTQPVQTNYTPYLLAFGGLALLLGGYYVMSQRAPAVTHTTVRHNPRERRMERRNRSRENPVVVELATHQRRFIPMRSYRRMKAEGRANGLRALPRFSG